MTLDPYGPRKGWTWGDWYEHQDKLEKEIRRLLDLLTEIESCLRTRADGGPPELGDVYEAWKIAAKETGQFLGEIT